MLNILKKCCRFELSKSDAISSVAISVFYTLIKILLEIIYDKKSFIPDFKLLYKIILQTPFESRASYLISTYLADASNDEYFMRKVCLFKCLDTFRWKFICFNNKLYNTF